MGTAFGKISSLRFRYQVVQTEPVLVRTYPACFVAEIECNDDQLEEANETLMHYIGFKSTPNNVKAASTEPVPHLVNTHIKMSLIVPVMRTDTTLQIVLPEEYTDLDQIPVPTDTRITIKSLPERNVAVEKFHGKCSRSQYMKHVHSLRAKLEKEHMLGATCSVADMPPSPPPSLASGNGTSVPPPGNKSKHAELLDAPTAAELGATLTAPVASADHWIIAQYHSHSTFAMFRKNEVWIVLDAANEVVAKMLAKAAQKALTTLPVIME